MTMNDVKWWRRAAPAPRPSHALLNRLWARYVEEVPHAATFARLAGPFENDHIALRTLARPGSGIEMFAAVFEALGWKRAAQYAFPDVHLRAIHMSQPGLPRIFISELDPQALSPAARAALLAMPADPPPPGNLDDSDALAAWFAAPPPPSAAALELVGPASQYGAWLLCFGRKVNHFTACVADVPAWQKRLLAARVPMKADIEGTPDGPLMQTATQASLVNVPLADGTQRLVPYAYFEIASRRDGFDGFLAPQARQLFDMTATTWTATAGDGISKRKHARQRAVLHIELGYGGVRVPVSSENISLGGMFLQMPDDSMPEAHTVLEMVLDLPVGGVRATGTVVYRLEGKGVGVEFTWWDDLDDPARQQLAHFLAGIGAEQAV